MKILLTAINAKYIHSNLAVYSLKTYAEKYGSIEGIELFETTINNRFEDVFSELYERKPDVIAFSCYIWNIDFIKELIVEIKKVMPHTKIFLGGPEVSYDAMSLMENMPQIELIMCGEGEETFLSVCKALNGEGKYNDIKGICYRNDANDIIQNEWSEPMDLSLIPFPYENIENLENRIVYYESSRGCPFSCSYCLSSVDKRLRFRDIELVKAELDFFVEKKVPLVKFVDRTFNCKPEHAMAIWEHIIKIDKGTTRFHFEVAADIITDEEIELIGKMRSGLIQLEVGVQSTNAPTIKEIKRVMNLEKVKSVVERIHKIGNTHMHLDLIAGLPYETLDEFKHSFDEVYKMRPDELQLGFLKVLKGSYMYEKAADYGVAYRNVAPYEVLETNWISFDDILELKRVEEVLEIYYNSGQFEYSVRYLEKYFDSPYRLYEALGNYYKEHFKKGMKHARIDRYNILKDFYFELECDEKLRLLFMEIMNFDIYLRENMHTRPPFAKDLSLYKDEMRNIIKVMDLTRSEHVEHISEDFYKYLLEKERVFEKGNSNVIEEIECDLKLENKYLVFDYKVRDALYGNGRVVCLKVM